MAKKENSDKKHSLKISSEYETGLIPSPKATKRRDSMRQCRVMTVRLSGAMRLIKMM